MFAALIGTSVWRYAAIGLACLALVLGIAWGGYYVADLRADNAAQAAQIDRQQTEITQAKADAAATAKALQKAQKAAQVARAAQALAQHQLQDALNADPIARQWGSTELPAGVRDALR